MSPLQVCWEESNWAADGGARFDCLSMAKNLKVRHKRRAGPRACRLSVMMQRQRSRRQSVVVTKHMMMMTVLTSGGGDERRSSIWQPDDDGM